MPFQKDSRTTREVEEGGRNGVKPRSMHNQKPYRPKNVKALAKEKAFKTEGGYYRCPDVSVQYHPENKGQRS